MPIGDLASGAEHPGGSTVAGVRAVAGTDGGLTKELFNEWNYKREALPADLQAEWEVLKKTPRNDAKRQKFIVDVANAATWDSLRVKKTIKVTDSAGNGGEWGSDKQLCDKHGEVLVGIFTKNRTVPSRPHTLLPADCTEVAWPLNKEWQLVRGFWNEVHDTTTSMELAGSLDEAAVDGFQNIHDMMHGESGPLAAGSSDTPAPAAASAVATPVVVKAEGPSKEQLLAAMKHASRTIGDWSRRHRDFEVIYAKSRSHRNTVNSTLEVSFGKIMRGGEKLFKLIAQLEVRKKSGVETFTTAEMTDLEAHTASVNALIKEGQKKEKVVALNVCFSA